LDVDETARIYALWKLAKAVIPHNEDGEYDSCILSAYGNALYFLARENLFLIELAIGRRVVGKFVDPEFWTMMFAPSRNANPELYERIDRALTLPRLKRVGLLPL
jgi:hypothetical protein